MTGVKNPVYFSSLRYLNVAGVAQAFACPVEVGGINQLKVELEKVWKHFRVYSFESYPAALSWKCTFD